MRVVLDTNILVSAALKPARLEAAVVAAVVIGRLQASVTSEIWAEYEEVLGRTKFARVRDECVRILGVLELRVRRIAAVAAPEQALELDDQMFLDCAFAAEANFLVTGNLKHYPPQSGPTRVVNARLLADTIGLE